MWVVGLVLIQAVFLPLSQLIGGTLLKFNCVYILRAVVVPSISEPPMYSPGHLCDFNL